MLKKLKVKRGCTVPRPSIEKSNGSKKLATTGSVDGCNMLPQTQFVEERPEFDIKPPLGAPLLAFTLCYRVKSFPQGDTSTRYHRFEISFPSPR